MIEELFFKSKKWFVFNMLDKNYTLKDAPEIIQFEPNEVLNFCQKILKNVTIIQWYLPIDFTIYMKHEYKKYWPMIYANKHTSYIEEIILVIQAFWFYNSLDFVLLDKEIQDETKALNHCKKFQKQIFIHIDNVAIEVKRYILCVKKIFWSNIPNRIIRISSLYDINIEQFDGIEDFIDLKLFKIW